VGTSEGGTAVSGVISSSTTWSYSNSPYIVTDDILLNEGITLTIEPGVTIKILSDKEFQVKGTLIAQGTSDSKITFTSNESSPSAGDWAYLKFYDEATDASFSGSSYSSGSIMEYCIVEYAETGLYIYQSAPFVHYAEFRYNSSQGIYVSSGDPRINNCDIHHNNQGIYISANNNSIIDYNTIRDNSPEGGGRVNATFSYNTIKNNTYSSNNNYDNAP
jgi:parallel beta-helix repeat protein